MIAHFFFSTYPPLPPLPSLPYLPRLREAYCWNAHLPCSLFPVPCSLLIAVRVACA
ncbi:MULTISPECIES: hypothetical protein [unclassified Moorena]|uniref:hypothetical protein n=1 Tax=unclassified Moorena TaxID=2683338 RepID=UPI00140166E2|nr:MULTISPECIES: hypothetical protein [unclassified Moorena]NEO13598.1 hypothetical protein [Moorena sp. SIO3E8]NEP99936.1 hypothetical protein [Moorena sp. SIO3F7]